MLYNIGMPNPENIVKHQFTSDQDREKAAINGRKGGIASGEAKRRKKDAKQMLAMLAAMPANDKLKKGIKGFAPGISDEEMTNAAIAAIGQLKAAASGSTKAYEAIQEAMEREESEELKQSDFNLSPLRFTKDFIEPYRVAREALEGKNGIREIISKGGRGSAKSNFWSAFAFETIKRDPQAHVVFTRRYKTDLRDSVFMQFKKTVRREDDIDNWTFTSSPMRAVYKPTGQIVYFHGCDNPISLKSMGVEFGYVKLLVHEECDEMAGVEQMDSVEDTFLRNDTPALDIKIFNPPKSKNNFMNTYTAEKALDPSTFVCHSYYYNVPKAWLGQRFFDRAEWFKKYKPQYYDNNYMGKVTGTGGELFDNVEERTITDEEIENFDYIYQGLDFGYEHPMAFIRVAYDRETDTLYPFFEHVRRRCKLSTFAKKLDEYKLNETICDSANPDKINDLRGWDWEAIGATKRWKGGGRDYAWEWLRTRCKIIVDPERTPHLAKEFRTLEFEQLKDGTFSSRYPDLGEDAVCATIYAMNRVIIASKDYEEYYDDYED